MTTMNKEVFEALIEAGASNERATAAAGSVADYQKDIGDVKHKLFEIKGEMTVLKWGIGLVVAVELIPYLKMLVL